MHTPSNHALRLIAIGALALLLGSGMPGVVGNAAALNVDTKVAQVVPTVNKIVANPSGSIPLVDYATFITTDLDHIEARDIKATTPPQVPGVPQLMDSDGDNLQDVLVQLSAVPIDTKLDGKAVLKVVIKRLTTTNLPPDLIAGVRIHAGDLTLVFATQRDPDHPAANPHTDTIVTLVDTSGLDQGALVNYLENCRCQRPNVNIWGSTDDIFNPLNPNGPRVNADAYLQRQVDFFSGGRTNALSDPNFSAATSILHAPVAGSNLTVALSNATFTARLGFIIGQGNAGTPIDEMDARLSFSGEVKDKLVGTLDWKASTPRPVTVHAQSITDLIEVKINPLPQTVRLSFSASNQTGPATACDVALDYCVVADLNVEAASSPIASVEVKVNSKKVGTAKDLPPRFDLHVAQSGCASCGEFFASGTYRGYPTDNTDSAQRPDLRVPFVMDGKTMEITAVDLPNAVDPITVHSKRLTIPSQEQTCLGQTYAVNRDGFDLSLDLATLGSAGSGIGALSVVWGGNRIFEGTKVVSAELELNGNGAFGSVQLAGGGKAVAPAGDYSIYASAEGVDSLQTRQVEFGGTIDGTGQWKIDLHAKVFDASGHLASMPLIAIFRNTFTDKEIIARIDNLSTVDIQLNDDYTHGHALAYFDSEKGGGLSLSPFYIRHSGSAVSYQPIPCVDFKLALIDYDINGLLASTMRGVEGVQFDWNFNGVPSVSVAFKSVENPETLSHFGLDVALDLDTNFAEGVAHIGKLNFKIDQIGKATNKEQFRWMLSIESYNILPSCGPVCFDRTEEVSDSPTAMTGTCVQEKLTGQVYLLIGVYYPHVLDVQVCRLGRNLDPSHIVCRQTQSNLDCGVMWGLTAALLPVAGVVLAAQQVCQVVFATTDLNECTDAAVKLSDQEQAAVCALLGQPPSSERPLDPYRALVPDSVEITQNGTDPEEHMAAVICIDAFVAGTWASTFALTQSTVCSLPGASGNTIEDCLLGSSAWAVAYAQETYCGLMPDPSGPRHPIGGVPAQQGTVQALDCTLAASLAVLGNLLYQQCGDRDAASCALAKAEEAIASYSGLVDDATSYYCDVADTQVFDRDTQPLNAPVGDPDGALGCTLNAVLVDGGGAQALLDACTASSDGGPDRINLNDVTPGAACNFVYTKAMEELALFVLDSPLVNCLLALPSNMGHWQFNGVPCTGTLNE